MKNNDIEKSINEESVNKSPKNNKAVIIVNNVGMQFQVKSRESRQS